MQDAPLPDVRSEEDLQQELTARARDWIPDWQPSSPNSDVGQALLAIAARLSSEVIERLNRTPEKAFRGFVDWLGMTPGSQRAARVPIFFHLTPNTEVTPSAHSVNAPVATRLQAALDQPVSFETTTAVDIVDAAIAAVVGVDLANDQFYLPSGGLFTAGPPSSDPTQWTTVADAQYPLSQLQLSAAAGLAVDQILAIAGQSYRITALQGAIVTFGAGFPASSAPTSGVLPAGSAVLLADDFAPFAVQAVPSQAHSLLIGDDDLLNLQQAAQIDIVNGQDLGDLSWSYWGPADGSTAPTWIPLPVAQPIDDGVTLLKPAGAVAATALNGVSTKWLRADRVGVSTQSLTLSQLELRVRTPGSSAASCPDLTNKPEDRLKYDAISNTTPLVTNTLFYPFGDMPRLFDTFYLGCQEAFGKAGAQITACIIEADPTLEFLAAWHAQQRAYGVSLDGRLQRLGIGPHGWGYLHATQPKVKDDQTLQGVSSANLVTLTSSGFRPIILVDAASASARVMVCADRRVWMWTEPAAADGYWRSLGDAGGSIEGLSAVREAGVVRLVARVAQSLRSLELPAIVGQVLPEWQDWNAPADDLDAPALRWKLIAPVANMFAGDVVGDSLIGVSADGVLYRYQRGRWVRVRELDAPVGAAIAPVAVQTPEGLVVIACLEEGGIVALSSGRAAPMRLDASVQAGFELLCSRNPEETTVLFSSLGSAGPQLSWWRPFDPVLRTHYFYQDAPSGPRPQSGAPLAVDGFVVVPGAAADLFVTKHDPDAIATLTGCYLQELALFTAAPQDLPVGVRVIAGDADHNYLHDTLTIKALATAADGATVAVLDRRSSAPASVGALRLVTEQGSFEAVRNGESSLHLAGHPPMLIGDWLLLGGEHERSFAYRVIAISDDAAGPLLTVDGNLPEDLAEKFNCAKAIVGPNRSAQLRLGLNIEHLGLAPAAVANAAAYHLGVGTERWRVADTVAAADGTLSFAILNNDWQSDPKIVLLDASMSNAAETASAVSDSPQLSWEYWNGAAWWKIDGFEDFTNNLLRTGTIRFCVPSDITATAVAGKTNTWIRARLVGGDYGEEQVSTSQGPDPNHPGATLTTIIRDDSDIIPPKLIGIDIRYRLCDARAPKYLLTFDNGSYSDQSDVNRAGGATAVVAFVPLATALGASSDAPAAGAGAAAACVSCDCGTAAATDSGTSTAPTTGTAETAGTGSASGANAMAAGRALYVGFDKPFTGDAVNLLWTLIDRDFSAQMPLEVAALHADGVYVPLAAGDQTRALGETNLLSCNVPTPAAQVQVFGQSLYWWRIRPAASANAADWSPQITGVYLNGVWAAQTETQTLEVLGSSVAAPNAAFTLLRPPVLADSLELRVKESLSVKERAQLNDGDGTRVIDGPENLPGVWVRWDQVPDPGDNGPTDRVYALDAVAGTVSFGDGRHGRIPPASRDGIAAFVYQRSSGAVANELLAWGSLSLVTPLTGVDLVQVPQAATGGADTPPPEQLLALAPSMIREHGRAITQHDFEQQTLESSPDVAQVSAITSAGRVRVIIAMHGDGVLPTLEQQRAVKAFLRERTSPSVAATLTVSAPSLLRLRVTLQVTVSDFDVAAAAGGAVRNALQGLLNVASGGLDGQGWQIGQSLTADDIAAALQSIPQVTALGAIKLELIDSGGHVSPLPVTLGPDQLLRLAVDDLVLGIVSEATA